MSSPRSHLLQVLVPALALAACTSNPPNEPSVLVLPGPGKSFEQFRADNDICRQFAQEQTAGTPDSAALGAGIRSAVSGAILGAAAGAAADGNRAGEGAAGGLALGGLMGAVTGDTSAKRQQQRYDNGFQQCMYAKGHHVPAAGGNLMSDFFQGSHSGHLALPPPPVTIQQ